MNRISNSYEKYKNCFKKNKKETFLSSFVYELFLFSGKFMKSEFKKSFIQSQNQFPDPTDRYLKLKFDGFQKLCKFRDYL